MSLDPAGLPPQAEAFLAEPTTASVALLCQDAHPLVIETEFSWEGARGLVRILGTTADPAWQLLQSLDSTRASLCRSRDARWLRLEGVATATADTNRVREAKRRRDERYGRREDAESACVIEIQIDRAWGPSFIADGLNAAMAEG